MSILNSTMVAQNRIDRHTTRISNGPPVVLFLAVVVIILVVVVIVFYWRKKRRQKEIVYMKLSAKPKPKLKLSLSNARTYSETQRNTQDLKSLEEEKVISDVSNITQKHMYDFTAPPMTPMTPCTPFIPTHESQKLSFNRSISVPAENVHVSNDRFADGLWRTAVTKASASQFLKTKPKIENKIAHCANGKMKFSLKYNILGQKELTVKIQELIDLPLSKETGISTPFVKVYLYPQTAHLYPSSEKNKNGFRVEILSFPRESTCSFVGCPIDKLCSFALKFVILDYDRFSRSEFVADCVILLDEVSLEGDYITKHLSIRKTFPDKDVGSLLVSLCYQPNGSRMCIIVLKASGLPAGESGHFSDHFVKISLLKNGVILNKRRTRVVKKNTCPVFNERLVFPVDPHGTKGLVFVFDVIRYDSKIKQEKMASVILGNHSSQRQVTPHEIQHFNEMLQSPQRQIAEWHKLVP